MDPVLKTARPLVIDSILILACPSKNRVQDLFSHLESLYLSFLTISMDTTGM